MNARPQQSESVKKLKPAYVAGLLVLGALPSLAALALWLAGVDMGIARDVGAALTEVPGNIAAFVMFKALIFSAAVSVAVLCFLQFKETGRIVKPLLAVPLLVGGLLELVKVFALLNWVPNHVSERDFIATARVVAEVLPLLYLCLLPVIFIAVDTARGKRQQDTATQWAAGLSLVLVAFSLWAFRSLTQSDVVQDLIMRGPFSGGFFRWLPMGLAIFLGVFIMPSYAKLHESIFVQTMWIACLPLALNNLHFALMMSETGWGWNYIAGNLAKLLAYLLPAIGLVWEYRWTHRAIRENNRALHDQLFMSAQLGENARNQERYLAHLLANTDNPVCIFDTSLRLVQINALARLMSDLNSDQPSLGLPPEKIFSSSLAALITKAGKEALANHKNANLPETWTGRIGGLTRTYQWSLGTIKDDQDKTVAVVGIAKLMITG
jgi:hypothetical protein